MSLKIIIIDKFSIYTLNLNHWHMVRLMVRLLMNLIFAEHFLQFSQYVYRSLILVDYFQCNFTSSQVLTQLLKYKVEASQD